MKKLRNELLSGRQTIGSWIQIGHPAVASLLGNAGFDWIAIDLEHTEITYDQACQLIQRLIAHNTVPLVRVSQNDELEIRKVLDFGAMGVIIPLINSAEDAKNAVLAAKYPPIGKRGFAFCVANNYGATFNSYVEEANESIVVIAMIESKKAIDNLDSILAVEGIDGVLVGPYDLSGSMGIPGQVDSPIIIEALDKIVKKCKDLKKSAGIHVVACTKENTNFVISKGFSFVALSMDTYMLQSAASKLLSDLDK